MRTHKLAPMRSLVQFPLMTVLFLFAGGATIAPPALAGSAAISQPGTVTGDSYSPTGATGAVITARIGSGMVSTLRTIQAQESVISVGGRTLSISPEQVATIAAVLSSTGPEVEPAIAVLEQQLSDEMGGLDIDVSVLGSSSGDLSTAIENANELILSLNSEQLAAAIESPTFMALLRVLGAANQALTDDGETVLVLEEGGGIVGILSISLL